jgi:hypothetical protein
MSSAGGGAVAPPPPSAEEAAFARLVNVQGKKKDFVPPPKFVKKLDAIPEIALPSEKPIHMAVSLADRALIGQFTGLWPTPRTTDAWVQNNWRPLISQGVSCYAIGRGYFLFDFVSKFDRDLIFRSGPYFMGPQGLYLNRWTPDFDPTMDIPKAVPVWVRLPNLPMHCWGEESLRAIGNGLGKYIDQADPKGQYSFARICVEVDLEAGLPEAIKLTVKGWQHFQQLDYEQLPFKCRHCHEYGHFQRHCPKLQEPEIGKGTEEGWQQMKKQKANPRRKGSKVSEPPAKAPPTKDPKSSKGQKEIQISNSGNSFAALEEQEPPDKANEEGGIPPPAANPLGEGSQVKETMNVESSDQQDKEDPHVEMASEEGSEEDDTEEDDIDQTKSVKKDKRGRKTDKERREAAAYRDKLAGVQSTIEKHLNPRNTRHQGNAAKGAASNPKGK